MNLPGENLTQICVDILKQGGNLDDLPPEKIPKLSDVMSILFGQTDVPIVRIADFAGMNNASIHKILEGNMHPSRNTLLRLALTLEASFETTQVLLKSANRSALSGGRDRDRIIMQGIIQKQSIGDICDILTEKGFSDLFSKQDF